MEINNMFLLIIAEKMTVKKIPFPFLKNFSKVFKKHCCSSRLKKFFSVVVKISLQAKLIKTMVNSKNAY